MYKALFETKARLSLIRSNKRTKARLHAIYKDYILSITPPWKQKYKGLKKGMRMGIRKSK